MGNNREIVIVGAGVAGLSLAYHLRLPYHIYEQQPQIGGLCRSEEIAGCTFDYAPRVLLPGDQYTLDLSQALLGENIAFTRFSDWSYHHHHRLYTRYPIQKHLYGLPQEVIDRCLEGLAAAVREFDSNNNSDVSSYREWLYRRVGEAMAEMLIVPQEQKKWKTDLGQMGYQWAAPRVERPDLDTALLGARQDIPQDRDFGYTRRGGIAALMNSLAADLSNTHLGVSLQAVDTARRIARFDDGSTRQYRALIATLPLPLLVAMLNQAPDDVREAAEELEHVSLLCCCLVVKREQVSDKHFVYVHDPDFVFHRVSFLSNLAPHLAPPGYSSLVAEVSYIGQPPTSEQELVKRVTADLIEMQILQPDDDIVASQVLHLPYAYPRPLCGWMETVHHIRTYLEQQDIHIFGRFGEWEYLNMHHIIPRSRDLAAKLEELYE